MSKILDTLATFGQRMASILARIGRTMAHWASGQSWGRLLVLAILALIAQSILTDNVLNWGDDSHRTHVAKHHRTSAKPSSPDDNVPDVHIGADGITVTHHRRKDASEATTTPGSTDTTAAPAAQDAATLGHDAAPASSGSTTTNTTGKPIADAGPSVSATTKVDPQDESDNEDDGEEDIFTARSPTAWLKSFVEGVVMLLIVYLIAAKIVMRQTAKSESRAAEAEASAAEAAAAASAAEASAEREALRYQLVQAQLQALQAQVEPHFLFNTLASVDYLIETDPARASAMQKNLIQYLRAALPQMRDKSSQLGREADLVRAYLEILKVRMEDRLTIVMDIPEGLRSAEFPPMMLQSLVENAIQHGVEPKAEGGEVRVSAAVVDGALAVRVSDSGIGLQDPGTQSSARGGVGLQNIRERLALLYPSTASFSLTALAPCGALAQIRIPYRVVQTAGVAA